MRVQLRITSRLLDDMRSDLRRKHHFAFERVGFLYCRYGHLNKGGLVVLGCEYFSVPDDQYLPDTLHGAEIGVEAFRDVFQHLHDNPVGVFHVHLHDFPGHPTPSKTDLVETSRFVPDFFHARDDLPHGALILSQDLISGRIWLAEYAKPSPISEFRIVGLHPQKIGGGS